MMAHRGPDTDLAEQTYTECWDQFQTWMSRHTSKTIHFDRLFDLEDEADEELDESLFHIESQNHTVYETDRELRASYYDRIEINMEDELLEPTLGPCPNSTHWINTFTTKRIRQYSSFSHIRHLNYIRGDVWIRKRTGERVRVASAGGDDEKSESEDDGEGKQSGNKRKNRKEEKEKEPPIEIRESLMDVEEARECVLSRKLVNLEADGLTATNQESMPFIPPEMKSQRMQESLFHYEGSFIDVEAWQHVDAGWDNNEDIIGAETVRRLLYIHQLTEERIDRTKVIPRDIRELYHFLRHRTYPDLDVIFPRTPPLPHLPLDEWTQKDEQATLASRIKEKAFNICCKIHCQAIMCPIHYTARERALTEQPAHETQEAQEADTVIRRGRGPQIPRWEVPKLPAHKLFAKFKREKRERCGEDCFYSLGVPEHGDSSFDVTEPEFDPDARTQADIESIWKVDPDAVPCDVAALSWDKVTCRQAYNIRNGLYGHLLEPEPDENDPGIEERRGGYSGGGIRRKIFPALEECDHPGPCVNNPYCPCYTSGRHCIRDCRCDIECKHRRTGCACGPSSKPLCVIPKPSKNSKDKDDQEYSPQGTSKSKCKCADNGLECDPELCKKCKARSNRVHYPGNLITCIDGGPCKNVGILMRRWKPTVVKPSQFGNGLFLAGYAYENDVVSGKSLTEFDLNTLNRNAQITWVTFAFHGPRTGEAKANGRNYLFDIPRYGKFSIDAGYTGNESRFANHPNNGDPNCYARYVWSGDEKHIGIYALENIWSGSELFLNYGEN
ncbi:unnamed protein product, partial [Rhizoctonia solani]